MVWYDQVDEWESVVARNLVSAVLVSRSYLRLSYRYSLPEISNENLHEILNNTVSMRVTGHVVARVEDFTANNG